VAGRTRGTTAAAGLQRRQRSKSLGRIEEQRGAWILYRPASGPTTNWLVSTAISGDYFERWKDGFSALWFDYADRHDLGIAIAVENLHSATDPQLNGAWQKLLAVDSLARELGRPLRCALIDSDVLISPLADDIFKAVDSGRIGIVSQVHGTPMEFRRMTNRIALYRREYIEPTFPLNSLLNASPRQVFEWAGLEPAMDDFACTGVLVCDSVSHADMFRQWYADAPSDDRYHAIGDWEQTYVNHKIQQRPEVQWLDYSWQALWMFEVAVNYPFLYSSTVDPAVLTWCVTASLLKHHFLHLAGRWESVPEAHLIPAMPDIADMSEFITRLRVQDGASEPAEMRGTIAPPTMRDASGK